MLAFLLMLTPALAAENDDCQADLFGHQSESVEAPKPDKEVLLTGEAANQRKARFNDIIAEFHRLNLSNLTQSYDRGEVDVIFFKRSLPWRRDISVAWRSPLKVLNIRSLDWEDAEERKTAALDLARALYKLEGGVPGTPDSVALDTEMRLLETHLAPAKVPRSRTLKTMWAVAAAVQLAWVPVLAPEMTESAFKKMGWGHEIVLPAPMLHARDSSNQPVPAGAQQNLMLQKIALERDLRTEQNKIYPDVRRIDTLKAEYGLLLERYPFLNEMPATAVNF